MLKEYLEKLCFTAEHPRKAMEAYITSGKKVAGCIPEYTPEPLLHAAGCVPFGLWGAETVISSADKYMPNFACSIMRSCTELALNGKYDGLSLVVVPVLCDALKGCSQTLRTVVKSFPTLPFALPQNRALKSAETFAAGEFALLQKKIEKTLGVSITEEALQTSIGIYNAHNAEMRRFAAMAAEHTDVITPYVRECVFKSAWFMDKAEHTVLVNAVCNELAALPVCRKNPIRVILSGVTAGSFELMHILEEEGFDVAGDWVYQDSWTYAYDIPQADTGIECLAKHWMSVGACCFAHDSVHTRPGKVLEAAEDYDASAVIVTLMKFCDPEEYELPQLLAEIRKSYPVLSLDIDQNGGSAEQLRTRIQSFREVLEYA